MPIIHEWKCSHHGEFEGSHGICPEFGCDSASVVKEIRTPRGISSGIAKRTDAGLRRTAESYGLSDFKSAKEGEMSKADNRSAEVLWGDEARKFVGGNLAVGGDFTYVDPKGTSHVARSGMRMAAESAGITQRRLPAAEITGHLADKE